jgi:hypothetical protein
MLIHMSPALLRTLVRSHFPTYLPRSLQTRMELSPLLWVISAFMCTRFVDFLMPKDLEADPCQMFLGLKL